MYEFIKGVGWVFTNKPLRYKVLFRTPTDIRWKNCKHPNITMTLGEAEAYIKSDFTKACQSAWGWEHKIVPEYEKASDEL